MACTYKVNGEVFDSIEDAREYRDGAYGEMSKKEVERIQSLVPNVPVKVIKGLIHRNGVLADGMFENQLITLSDTVGEGVGYHESFHAISQMFLDSTERSDLYEKAYPTLSPAEAEEALANDFKDYMLTNEKKSFLQRLFDGIKELVNYYFKGGKDRIFRKARKGKYKNLNLSGESEALFNKIDMNHIEKYDFTQLMAHKAIVSAGLLTSGDLSFKNWKSTWSNVIQDIQSSEAQLNDELTDLYNKQDADPTLVDESEIDTKENLVDRYTTILNNKDSFEQFTLDVLRERGLTSDSVDESIGEDGVVGKSSQNIDSSLKASGMMKTILSTMVDSTKMNESTQQAELVDFNEVYAVLSRELAGMVEGEADSGIGDKISQVKSKLISLLDKRPYLNSLVELFNNDSIAENTKIHLLSAFANQKQVYTTTVNDWANNKIRHINADSSSFSSALVSAWAAKNEELTPTQLRNIVGENGLWNNLKQEYKKVKMPLGSGPAITFLQKTAIILNKLGVDVTVTDLTDFVQAGKGSAYAQVMDKEDSLNGAISFAGYSDSLINQIEERGDENPLTNASFRKLAEIIANNSDAVSDGSIYSNGKSYYPITLNNNQSKTIARFKQDRSLISKRRGHLFHKHSKWLTEMESMNDVDVIQIQEFLAESFPDDKYLKDFSYGDLNGVTDIMSRINRLTMGYFQIPTLAEKKTFPQIKGFEQIKADTYDAGAIQLIGYMQAEAERIQWANMHSQEVAAIDVYEKKAKLFQLFPSLNDNSELMESLNEGTPFELSEFRQLFIDTAKAALKKQVTEVKSYLEGEGVITNYKGISTIAGLNEQAYTRAAQHANKVGNTDGVTPALIDATTQGIIGNIEFMMMFAGDPAFYKDITKRSIATSSTGVDNHLLTESNEPIAREYNMAVVKDNTITSARIVEYEAMIRRKYSGFGFSQTVLDQKVADELDAYSGMDEGDALGVASPSRYRDIMRMQGKWPKGADAAYDVLMSNDLTTEIPYEAMALMASIKGHYFGLTEKNLSEDGLSSGPAVPVFVKYSLFPLFPRLITDSKYQKIYDSMVKNNTQEVVFESGVKAGATNTLDMNDPSNTNEDGTFNYSNMILDNMNWKLQQPTPNKLHTKGEQDEASQHQKNITANVELDKQVYDGGTKTGREMIAHLTAVGEAISKLGYEKYTKKVGITGDKIVDRKKFNAGLIQKQIEDGKSGQYQLDQLRRNAPIDSMMSLGSGPEMDILSALNKGGVKTKMPGAGLVQISSFGFDKLNNMDRTQLGQKGGIKWFKDVNVLEGSHIKDGKFKRAQVLIPHMKMKELREVHSEALKKAYNVDSVDDLTGEQLSKIFADSLTGVVGYRIPGQGFASIDTFEVVGILPEGMGDSIITYQDVVGKTGSDFDIDKMYVMMHNLKFNKETNKLEKIKYNKYDNPDALADRWDAVKDKKNQTFEEFSSLSIPQQNGLQALQNEKLRIYDSLLQTHANEAVTPVDAKWLAEDAKIKHAYRTIAMNHVNRIKKEPVSRTWTEIAREAFSRSESQLESFKGLSTKGKLNWIRDNIDIMGDLEFFTSLNQMKVKAANTVGAIGTGISANHVSHHPIAQQAGLNINIDLGFGRLDLSQTRNKDGYITDVLNAYINGFVDNVKDPFLGRINNNEITSNAGFLLLRSGIDPKWVNSLLHQPIIHEYVAFKRDQKTPIKKRLRKSEKVDSVKTNGVLVSDSGIISSAPTAYDHKPTGLEKFVLDKYGEGAGELLVNTDLSKPVSLETLNDNILSGIGSRKTQLEVLAKYIAAEKLGAELSEAIAVSRTDTQGAELSGIEVRSILERRDSLVDRGIINNVEKTWGAGTTLETKSKYSLDKSISILESELLSFTPGTWATVKSTVDSLQLFDTKDTREHIFKYFKSYVASGSSLFNMTKEQHADVLATAPVQFKKYIETYPDITLNKVLTVSDVKNGVYGGKVPHIKGPRARVLPHKLDQLTEDWENMLNDDTVMDGMTVRNKDIAQNLLLYMFATSGGNKIFNSFENIVPPNILALAGYENHIKLSIQGLQTGDADVNFIQQYALNFSDKLKFVANDTEKTENTPEVFNDGSNVMMKIAPNEWRSIGSSVASKSKRPKVFFDSGASHISLGETIKRNVEVVSITDEGVVEDLGAKLIVKETTEKTDLGQTTVYHAALQADGKSETHSPSVSTTYKTQEEAMNAGRKVLLAFNKEKLNQIIKGC